MNEPDSLAVIISQHFDAANTPEETAQLATELTTNRPAALEFVRIARMDALLGNTFSSSLEKPRRLIPWRKLTAAAAIILATLGLGYHNLRNQEPPPAPMVKNIRTVKPVPLTAPEQAESLSDLLARFYVTTDLRGKRVSEVLQMLPSQIQERNLLNNPKLNGIRFEMLPGGKDAIIKTSLPTNSRLKEILEVCSIHCPVKAITSAETLDFQLNPPSSSDLGNEEEIQTRVYLVPPDFMSWRAAGDEFTQNTNATPTAGRPEVRAILSELFGVILGQEETANFLPGTASLIIKTTIGNHLKLDKCINLEARRRPLQIQMTLDILVCPRSVFGNADTLILTDNEWSDLAKELDLQRHKRITAPTVVSRGRQPATVEIINGTDLNAPWVGLSCPFVSQSFGEVVRCSGTASFGIESGQTILQFSRLLSTTPKIPPIAPQVYPTEFDAYIPAHHVALFTLDVPVPDGLVGALAVRTMQIDPSGQPLRGSEPPPDGYDPLLNGMPPPPDDF